ncbi:ATP-binding protein [Candidatus Chloroploca asiatica]|uniref:Bacterial transcriptional activator domain-containing protein n=1 Tax=Candidatus Chloroploca asiatica TaxID=1506545 RepID=A0A2H3KPU3_9CHLR|nr:tetratricopeptide repeat protein [Candidatus Chloroploca asiatica]PDV97176.1 hypothetical protein A9Q02_04510 [Candidatus Chloroploca asiatica]
MQTGLDIRTFGGLTLQRDGQPLGELGSRKAEALLVYLAYVGRPVAREIVADLLWGEMLSPDRARANLSVLLTGMRHVLGPYLETSRREVGLNPQLPCSLDAAELIRLLTPGRDLVEPARYETGLALYRGEFLQGFAVRDTPTFEAWVLAEQEHLRRLVLMARRELTRIYLDQGAYAQGILHAEALLADEPFDDEVQQRLMLLLAHHGQLLAALASYDRYQSVLERELGVAPSAEVVALYQRLRSGDFTHTPVQAIRTEPTPRALFGFPSEPTSFIGREQELHLLAARLADPACRLLTLIGPGGIGKTRLASQAALAHAATMHDGAVFVALAPLEQSDQVPTAIATTLGWHLDPTRPPLDQVLDGLRERQMFVLLDNAEHLPELAPIVNAILQAAPDVRLLVTSREPLRLRAEWLIDLEGLAYPRELTMLTPPQLARYSAVQLFVQRAIQVSARFQLDEREAPAVATICRLVEGMPLGIELAAAWARELPCATIAQEVARNTDFLATRLHDVPARQRSLRAIFNHSWQLLNAQERATLTGLAVFRGGCTLAAAEEVLGHLVDRPIRPLLRALVEKSLVRQRDERYELHELLRQFATERLEAGGAGATRAHHSTYFLQTLADALPALTGRNPRTVTEGLRADLANLRQAWEWASEHGQADTLGAAADALALLYERLGLLREGEGLFQSAADHLMMTAQTAPSASFAAERVAVIARLRAYQGRFTSQQGQHGAAVLLFGKIEELLPLDNQPALAALVGRFRGNAHARQGDYGLGEAYLRQALGHAEAAGLPHIEADCRSGLGWLAEIRGDYAEARAAYEASLLLARSLGDAQRESIALANLGVIAEEQGRCTEAREAYMAALVIDRAIGDCPGEGMVLNNLGVVAYDEGHYSEAEERFTAALNLSRSTGDRRSEAIALVNLGRTAREQGAYQQAHTHYQASLELRRAIGNRLGEAHSLSGLGMLFHLMGDQARAERYVQEALDLARALGARSIIAYSLTYLGHIALAQQNANAALDAYREALELRLALHQPARAMQARAGLALAALLIGDRTAARSEVEALLGHLNDSALHSSEDLLRIFGACWRVLTALEDPRADGVMQQARTILAQRAAMITDPVLRRSYLEDVEVHRLIAAVSC